ncbi:virion protein [Sphingomonas phage Eidolon]|uniref:Virion protein n=1 Tax=Sphingomonas phage Eidolon TaxID=2686311 RepID=A0A6M3T7Z4_9CAUD|nr:virion protein [Sphingomonas phage Eidolon]QJD54406.1 virion protein [Sphingomonas phage Eidolon]
MGKGGKAQTVGYKYYLGMHLGLCHGPIDAITRLRVDERDAWVGANTGGSINVNAPSLFGGDAREGGVSGVIDVAMGGPAQGQNSYLVSKLGALIPAYRGIVGLIFRQCYLGNNPYLKTWSARGQRIHVRQNGIAQWYDEKSVIAAQTDAFSEQLIIQDVALDANGSSTNGSDGGYNFGLSDADVLIVTAGSSPWSYTPSDTYPGFPNGWTYRFGIRNVDTGTVYGPYWTEDYPTQANGTTARAGERLEVYLPAGNYKFFLYDATVNDNRGTGRFALSRLPGIADMNPAHIIRECLTDPNWGMGYTDGDVDDASFMAAADTFSTEGLGMSLLWDKSKDIEDFVTTVIQHVDAALYVSRTTGKFVLKAIRGDYDEGSLLLLDESNIQSVTDPVKLSFGELTNSVTVTYWDASTGKDATVTVTDPALALQQGVIINAPVQYPGFTNARNATIAAQRDLRALSSPLLSCTILAHQVAKVLNIGDVFKFSWGKWGIVNIVMRVTGIAYGTGRNKRVKITCSQDVFNTDTNVVVLVPNSDWTDPSQPPTAVPEQLATEAPYYELVQILGQADTDNKLLTHPEIGYVVAAAGRPTSAINARINTDSGEGYTDAGAFDFAPFGRLVTNIGKVQTSFFIEDGSDLDEIVEGTHFQIGNELLRIDAIDTETGEVEVGRGVLDTVPQEHLAGDVALFWDRYAGFDPTEYVMSEIIDVKVVPISGAGVFPIEEAETMEVTLSSRAARPYAPGDLRVNGESYADNLYNGELAISWAHRNRIEQTGGHLVDYSEGDIGPEVGTVYRLQGYIDGVLDHTEDDIAGTSTTWTPSADGRITVEVHSKRDDLYSYQGAFHDFYYADTNIVITVEGEERRTEEGDLRIMEN